MASKRTAPVPSKKPAKAKKAQAEEKTLAPVAVDSNGKSRGGLANLRPFPKGVSGNPGGRQKVDKTVKALAREFTAASIQRLGKIVMDDSATPSAQVAAAQALLDRGWGKPLMQLEVGEAGAFSSMEDAELDVAIAKMSEKLAALTHCDEEQRVVN